jgi:type II secretory pathway component GspD/PulD (secretin)
MKAPQILILPALLLAAGLSHAQAPAEKPVAHPVVEPVVPITPESATPGSLGTGPGSPIPAKPVATDPVTSATTPQKNQLEASDEGYLIKDAPINDIFQFLAKAAGRQYFHNAKISGPDFRVTGHLNDGNPLTQMEELAFMYGLALHTKGNTIYALTQAQLAQLPSIEFHYQLQYLRPTDIKQIQELIKPMLSPATGIVNFEPKTNTIIIIDAAHRIEQARLLLRGIDKAKGQIIVETKILRINTKIGEYSGIDWSSSFGETGTSLKATMNLNSIFNISNDGTANVVLSPVQITGVLHALADGGLASQISNPTLITEDNEQATISIIDRIPIITQTQSGSGTTAIVTEEVRYKIDAADKSIDTDPALHREIGISLVVTPTLLPDGTVRMKMRPRSAQIVDYVEGVGTEGRAGNKYPRVTESMLETLARVPNGYSLVVGGFYGEVKTNGKTKMPLLGDIPIINFFFKSKEASKENTSLVFIVTPKSYDPTNRSSNANASSRVRNRTSLSNTSDWIDEKNPGPAHEPNWCRSVRGLKPQPAPYYPLPGEGHHQAVAPEPPAIPQPYTKPRLTKARRD